MGKEYITGLIVRDDIMEWMSALKIKGRLNVTTSGKVSLAVSGKDVEAEGAAGGESNDIAAGIKSACKGIKGGNVTICLDSSQLLLRVLSLPMVEDDVERAGMVELQVDKFSPFPVDNMVVSHEVLDTDDDFTRVLIAAVKKDIIISLGEKLSSAGVHPLHVDIIPLVWLYLLRNSGKILEVGWQTIVRLDSVVEIMVLKDGIPVMIRSLGSRHDTVSECLFNELIDELKYTLLSLELEHGVANLNKVVLWHHDDSPVEAGMSEKVAAECACEVVLESLESLPPFAEGLVKRAALRDGRMMDLAPEAWGFSQETKKFRKKSTRVAISLLGGWVVCTGLFLGGFHLQEYYLDRLEQEQNTWREKALEVGQMRRRAVMIGRYMDRTQSALECLREISESQPNGVELGNFEYTKGEKVEINGDAGSAGMFYEFKKQLDESKLFIEVEITSGPTRSRQGKEGFSLRLKLPTGEQ